MRQQQMATLAMQKTVLQTLDNYSSHWAYFLPFSTEVAALRSLIAGTTADNQAQAFTVTKGHTGQKNEAIETALEATYKLAKKLKVWAAKQHNGMVYQAANISRSSLARYADAQKITHFRLILNIAKENIAALGDYQVTAGNNAILETLIDVADASILNRDVMSGNHHTATSGIATKIKSGTAVLHTLDDLVEGFTDAGDAEFVTTYFSVRKSRQQGRSRAKKVVAIAKQQEGIA